MGNEFGVIEQAGAVPLRNGRVCLVTNRSGKRWLIPKGCMEPNRTPAQIALAEAWEEAGVTGALSPEPVGSYVAERNGLLRFVLVYAMEVTEALNDWPERRIRRRAWLDPERALRRIKLRGLRDLLRSVLTAADESVAPVRYEP